MDLTDIRWHWSAFDALSAGELYAALTLRQQVFVLEQNCLYPDLDGLDPHCWHLLGWLGPELGAYLRLIPPTHHASEYPAIGRVVVSMAVRGRGLGRQLMIEGLRGVAQHYPEQPVMVSAQAHLQRFYETLGFCPVSDVYLEDGIPHLDMLRHRTPGVDE